MELHIALHRNTDTGNKILVDHKNKNNPNKRQGGPWGGQSIYDTGVKTGGVVLQDY